MTYAKPIPAASRALCGRSGQSLVDAFCRTQRQRRVGILAWVFLGPDQLARPDLLARVADLDPTIGLVIRDYRGTGVSSLLKLAKAQRRICLLSPANALGFGRHIPQWQRPIRQNKNPMSMSVHTAGEAMRARRKKAGVVFVSPIFATSSHPGARPLGAFQARRLARLARCTAYGLGGIEINNVKTLGPAFAGVAAISAFLKPD